MSRYEKTKNTLRQGIQRECCQAKSREEECFRTRTRIGHFTSTIVSLRCKEYQERGESSFPGNGVRSREGEAGRVSELEKRLKDAETERDILKKALGIISKSDR